ncbi:hypothetical protein FACS1894140_4350 [Spirochaetia bacterium]|nr:hypothetical protein FACS1894140_4350 [Spirochaetia bacterium]
MIEKPESSAGEPKPSRPNAGLPLTENKNINPDEELVFYYSRERRLQKASQAVRDLHKETKPVKFSLLRALFSSKANAFMFFFVLIIAAISIFLSIYYR